MSATAFSGSKTTVGGCQRQTDTEACGAGHLVRSLVMMLSAALSACHTLPPAAFINPNLSNLGQSIGDPAPDIPSARIFVLADNQERHLYGEETFYSELIAHEISKVAIRSSAQDLYAKFAVQAAVDDIVNVRAPERSDRLADPIIHLGDLLDYSCRAELKKLDRMEWMNSRRLTIAPGNHDGLFQGNGSYVGDIGSAVLKIRHPGGDSTLNSHHNAVCMGDRPLTNQEMPRIPRSFAQEAHRRRSGLLEPREEPDWTARPQVVRCYLLTRQFGESHKLDRYCEDHWLAQYYRVPIRSGEREAREGIEIDWPNADQYKRRAHFRSDGGLIEWNQGHLVQSIQVPLVPQSHGMAVGTVLVILLDTQGWTYQPSADNPFGPDATVGIVGKHQQKVVNDWVAKFTHEEAALNHRSAIVFAGHYPLGALDMSTVDWLIGLQKKSSMVLPLYLSAHTHTGYLAHAEGSRGEIWEINTGSMIDDPPHYRDVRVSASVDGGWEVRSQAYMLEEALQCRIHPDRREAFERGQKAGERMLEASQKLHPWWTFRGAFATNAKPDWCLRLKFTEEELGAIGHKSQYNVTQEMCASGSGGHVNDWVQSLSAAETELITEVSNGKGLASSHDLASRYACAAIGGSRPFATQKPPIPKYIGLRWTPSDGRWRLAN